MRSKTRPKALPRVSQAPPTPEADWDTRLGFLIHDVSRLRRSTFDEVIKPVGLTRSQWWVLANIARQNGVIQSELAEALDLGKASLGQLLDKLEESQFIERRPDATDRRVKHVFLTAAGAKIVQWMRSKAHELSEIALVGLSARQRQALVDSLRLIKHNLLQSKSDVMREE